MHSISYRVRAGLILALLVVIAIAGYRVGTDAWIGYHRRSLDSALARRDFNQAQLSLEKCLRGAPHSPELHLQAARLARRLGNLDAAQRHLKRSLADEKLRDFVRLEQCLLEIQKGEFANSQQLDDYAREYPDSPEAMLIEEAQIRGSIAALDIPRAQAYLAKWLEHRLSTADQVQALNWRATASLLTRDAEQASTCFREAVKLDPTNREALLALSQILADSDPNQAAEHLRTLRGSYPPDAEILYQQAFVERNLGQLEAAARTLDELLTLAPNHVEGLVLHGRIALDRQQAETAGDWLRRAESLEPKHREVLQGLVDYLRFAGRNDEAERYEQRMRDIQAEVIERVNSVIEARQRQDRAAAAQSPPEPSSISP